ncbi:MAG: histidine phosphatase family protein [Reinekea sp.]
MTIYLVRHDKVIANGLCYGQTDLATLRDAKDSAQSLFRRLPEQPALVFTSPLSRCSKLAEHCYPNHRIINDERLMEVNFGAWEARLWDRVPRTELDNWAKTPTDFGFPGGEHLRTFQQRVSSFAAENMNREEVTVIFSHAGVIRLLCAYYYQQDWSAWLGYPAPFLSVTRLHNRQIEQSLSPEIC